VKSLVPTLVLALVLAPLPARSEPPPELTPENVKAAIEKGAAWLKKQQSPDGSFQVVPVGAGADPPGKYESHYVQGTTALGLLTLLKCGVKPDDKAIEKGFNWLMEQPLTRTYSVAMTILALEARFAPKGDVLEKNKDKPYETVARGNWNKIARPVDKKWLDDLVKWLLSKQAKSVWRYPSPGEAQDQDNSNTQYAVLALKSASRLGCEIPEDTWRRVAEYFVLQQDPTGPDVDAFPVPAADGPIRPVEKKEGTTVDKASDPHKLKARGWSYAPRPVVPVAEGPAGSQAKPGAPAPPPPAPPANVPIHEVSTGSMTNSGIAALVCCKSELERDKAWWAKWGPRVDQGIRDGCAWLAHNFTVHQNPPARGWKYYYLYGLERAGVMAGTYELGKHDWYDEGALHLLELQQQAEGSWPADSLLSEFTDTCFALLFLRRGTIPLVKLPPKRTMTGIGGAEPPPAPPK
jgi:hypothetical protein